MGHRLVRQGGSVLEIGLLGMLALAGACGPSTTKNAASDGGAANSGSPTNAAGAGADPGSATDLNSFLEQQGRAFCERLFKCFEANDDFMAERFVLESVQGCQDEVARVDGTDSRVRDLVAQVQAGNLHYMPEQGQKCVAALAECNGPNSFWEGPCSEAFDGKAQIGENCQRHEDCAGDAYCASDGMCAGQCQPRKQLNESCQGSQECAQGGALLVCDRNSAPTSVCRALDQSPKASLGQACTRAFTGVGSLVLCQDNLWCATVPGGDPATDALGHCIEPIAGDGACVDSDDVCLEGMCDTVAGVCRPFTMRKKAGESCDRTLFVFCDPLLGLRCSDAGTCEGSGDGSEGSGCFGGDLQRGCDPGLFCDEDPLAPTKAGTCRALLPAGAACETPQSCSSGSCSDQKKCLDRPCFY